MFGFLRRLGGPVRYEQPCREPHRDELDIIPGLFPPVPDDMPERLAIEQEIARLDQLIWKRYIDGHTADMNRQLDKRNTLRPPRPAPVPVIPGRS